ncbi:MAG: hypothetical protein V6Z81_05330 [Parvularculales bacterium]
MVSNLKELAPMAGRLSLPAALPVALIVGVVVVIAPAISGPAHAGVSGGGGHHGSINTERDHNCSVFGCIEASGSYEDSNVLLEDLGSTTELAE